MLPNVYFTVKQCYNNTGDSMFKKFYSILVFSSIFISIVFSNSNNSKQDNSYVYPTDTTYISSYYGNRLLFGKQNFHNGIDFPAIRNSKVYASKSGLITFSGYTNGYGICITILHSDGTKSMYGHLSENVIIKVGQKVNQGEIIGYVGPVTLSDGRQNGWTTGPHLHFSIYDRSGNTLDPYQFEYKKSK